MPELIPLWKNLSDNDPRKASTLSVYLCPTAPAATATATVLVCPGGGYAGLADHEGPTIAQWLNAQGFHAAVLRYRLQPNRHPAMINDAQRAMRILRAGAERWGIKTDGIAVLGFSAGGHLASSLATLHDRFTSEDDDLARRVSARPDAAVLCYPVIDMQGPFTHRGSRDNLLGPGADASAGELMSTHLRVSPTTPPTFLWHTSDDAGVPMENSLLFAMACRKMGVPVEVHSYESGRHGLGLSADAPDVAPWTDTCVRFLKRHLI
jgi:acetyl esterase/lipase